MTALTWIAIGFVLGLVITAAVFMWIMRHRMVVATRSRRTFDKTCEAFEEAVATTKGWALPIGSWDLYERFRKKKLVPANFRKLKIYFLCNSALASGVVGDTPAMAGIMPCSWSIYELEDNSVWISRMNIGMMAMVFSGGVGKAMRRVEEADQLFLALATGGAQSSKAVGENEAT